MSDRKQVSRRLRFEILKRDSYTCRYCRATDQPLTVDHVVPVALGGDDEPGNLVTACKDCNAGKTSTSPDAATVAQVSDDAVRWADAMKLAAADALGEIETRKLIGRDLDELWCSYGWGKDRTEIWRPENWRDSVATWESAGLPMAVILDSATKALENNRVDHGQTWRYFCGIAWRRLTELQDAAKAHLNPAQEVVTGLRCEHCEGCLNSPDEDACHVWSPDPDDEPEPCRVCEKLQCEMGHARAGGLIEGHYEAWDTERRLWKRSFTQLQLSSLIAVVDGLNFRSGRAI